MPHVAAGQLTVSSGTDHVPGDQAAPPVGSAAGFIADNGETRLLQDFSDRSPSLRREGDSFSPNGTRLVHRFFLLSLQALTPETAPSGHVAAKVVWQDHARCRKTGGFDIVA